MSRIRTSLVVLSTAYLLAACDDGRSPGHIGGDWEAIDTAMTCSFRQGEVECLGVIAHATYKDSGGATVVTYTSGVDKGNSTAYTYLASGELKSADHTYRRVER